MKEEKVNPPKKRAPSPLNDPKDEEEPEEIPLEITASAHMGLETPSREPRLLAQFPETFKANAGPSILQRI